MAARRVMPVPDLRRLAGLWWLAALLVVLGAALGVAGPAAAQNFPRYTGLVVDAADVLPAEVHADLTRKLQSLQNDTKRQLVVVTVPDLGGYPIEEYGYKLGRSWGVGLRDVNNGAVFLIAPKGGSGQRHARIEVGRGLEPVITDALSSVIINQQVLPRARNGDVPGAIVAGTDALIAQLRAAPDEAKARTDAAAATFNRNHRAERAGEGGIPLGLIFWLVVLGFVAAAWMRRGRGDQYHRGGNWPIMLWGLASALGDRDDRGGGGDGGGWGGGASGGGDGSWTGGDFTGGGGGDFGGGGASGSW